MKNIFLIVLDSVRRDFIFNNIKENFLELKSDFVDFKNCWSIYTSTYSSHYSIFFGDYINRSKSENFPAQLKNLGFKTRSFCNNAVVIRYPLENELRFLQKKQVTPSKEKMMEDLGMKPLRNWKRRLFGKFIEDFDGAADDEKMGVPENWRRYIIDNKENKNFIFLHFWKTHHNYYINNYLQNKIEGESYRIIGRKLIKRIVKKELSVKFVKKIYAKRIYESFNKYIKELINNLKENDIYDNSLIIITSDHGEGLGDIGKYCNKSLYYLYYSILRILRRIRRKFPNIPEIRKIYCCKWDSLLFFHSGDYKLQKFIPLFIKFPKNELGGTICQQKVTLFDLIHTINDLTGNKIKIKNNNGCSLYHILKEGDTAREKSKILQSIQKIRVLKL